MSSNIGSKQYLDYAGLSYFKSKLDLTYATINYVDGEDSFLRNKFSNYLPLTGGSLTDVLSVSSNVESVAPNAAAIEVRERGRLENTISEVYANAPRIGFHWSNLYWANLAYISNSFRFVNQGCSAYIDVRAKDLYEDDVALSNKYLEKLPFEWNKNINFGSTGYLLIGKFPMYDSNITIDIDSTTSNTYHATLVIATQNINTSRGGSWKSTVYGDALNTVAPSLKIKYSSGSNVFEVYFSPQAWSKNLIHIRATGLAGTATNICESVSSLPSTDLIDIINALTSNFLSSSGGTLTGHLTMDTGKYITLSGAGIQLSSTTQPTYTEGRLTYLSSNKYLYFGTDGTAAGTKRLAYVSDIPSLSGYATETWVSNHYQPKLSYNYTEVTLGTSSYTVSYNSGDNYTVWNITNTSKWDSIEAMCINIYNDIDNVNYIRCRIMIGDLDQEIQLLPVLDYKSEGEAFKKLSLVGDFPTFNNWNNNSKFIIDVHNKIFIMTKAQMNNNMWEFYKIKLIMSK